MELQEFTKNAIKTESLIDRVEFNSEVLDSALMSFIASAEILDMIKKNVFYGKSIDPVKLTSSVLTLNDSSRHLALHFVDDGAVLEDFPSDSHQLDPRLFHAIIGICTESGELAELLHESMTTESDFDVVNFGEELGDIDWYKAIGADAAGLDPGVILSTVIKKLQKRFPDKFTSNDAINRDLRGERELLESNL